MRFLILIFEHSAKQFHVFQFSVFQNQIAYLSGKTDIFQKSLSLIHSFASTKLLGYFGLHVLAIHVFKEPWKRFYT